MARWEAGSRERWPKILKEELENESKMPKGPTVVGKLA
jgi:hypothetical protein